MLAGKAEMPAAQVLDTSLQLAAESSNDTMPASSTQAALSQSFCTPSHSSVAPGWVQASASSQSASSVPWPLGTAQVSALVAESP